jgi:hypothetical protein
MNAEPARSAGGVSVSTGPFCHPEEREPQGSAVPPIFPPASEKSAPPQPAYAALRGLDPREPDDRLVPFPTGERFNFKEDHAMTIAYRIHNNSDFLRIECCGQTYSEDELHEAIWLHNIELRGGLPRREQIEAKQEIAQLEELLAVLRSAGP